MVPQSSIRLISYLQELVDVKPLYVSSNCLPVKGLDYEPAGYSYHLAATRLLGFFEKEDDNQNVPNAKGLGHLRYLATDDQIKKSYRETALKFHPDKQASLILSELTEAAKQTKEDEMTTTSRPYRKLMRL
ncbi:hypothetical protein AgCh_009599 [Apium graveolens]